MQCRQVLLSKSLSVGLMMASFAACHRKEEQHKSSLVLQREWTANAEYAGDLIAHDSAPNYGIELTVREGGPTLDPIKQVRSGLADIGVASADRVLRENEAGARLVVLGAATYKSPVVFISRAEFGLTTPRSMKGRIIGIQSGTNTDLILRSVLAANGMDTSSVHIVESGWGTQAFETKQFDLLGAFAYDEPVSLGAKGIRLNAIYPDSAGVHFVGTVYFTRAELIERNPIGVQAAVTSLVKGWRTALADTVPVYKDLSVFKGIDLAKEKKSFLLGREYFSGENGRPLFVSPERWKAMARDLIALRLLKTFSFEDNIDYRFLDRANEILAKSH